MPSPCCSLRHSVARPDGARSRALIPVRLCTLLPPFVCQAGMTCPAPVSHWFGRPCSASTPLASRSPPGSLASRSRGYAEAVGFNVDNRRSTHHGGGDRYAGAVRGSISPAHIPGPCPPAARRLPAAGPCGIASGRARPCISLAPCLCRPWAMSASCTSAQGRPLCPRCSPVAPLPTSSAHLPTPTAAIALRVRGFGSSGVREFGRSPLPRHCTASGRRSQDGLRPACGG